MLALLFTSIFGVSFTCVDMGCAGGLEGSINIRATIIATSTLATDIKPIAIAGFYKLEVEYSINHQKNAGNYAESYLVIDDRNTLQEQKIVASLLPEEARVDLDIPLTVLAVHWPSGMTEEEVLAFYDVKKVKVVAKK